MLLRLQPTIWIVFVWMMLGGRAFAADPAASTTDDDTEPVQTIEVDSGITADSPFSPNQLYGYLDILFAPGGDLDKSGFRLRVGSEGGTEAPVSGLNTQASFLLGYSFESETHSLLLMSGVDVQNSQFNAVGRANRVGGTAFGWKGLAQLDTKPTQSTMLNAQASYSTAFNEYYIELETGYAIAKETYLGPMVAFLGDDYFAQGRLGGDLSGIKLGPAEFTFHAGYLQDFFGNTSVDEGKVIRVRLNSETDNPRDPDDEGLGMFAGTDVSVRY
jgi:hypothetical protein